MGFHGGAMLMTVEERLALLLLLWADCYSAGHAVRALPAAAWQQRLLDSPALDPIHPGRSVHWEGWWCHSGCLLMVPQLPGTAAAYHCLCLAVSCHGEQFPHEALQGGRLNRRLQQRSLQARPQSHSSSASCPGAHRAPHLRANLPCPRPLACCEWQMLSFVALLSCFEQMRICSCHEGGQGQQLLRQLSC